MGRITIQLDEGTQKLVRRAASKVGLSEDRWLARLIRENTAVQWPEEVVRLAGAWKDMPLAEEIRAGFGEDGDREPL